MSLREKHDRLIQSGRLVSMLELLGGKATCDECGRWESIPTLIKSELPTLAAERGWSKDARGHDLCPLCTKGRIPSSLL